MNTTKATEKKLLTINETCAALGGGVSARTIRRWAKEGVLRVVKNGNRLLVPKVELERLAAGEISGDGGPR